MSVKLYGIEDPQGNIVFAPPAFFTIQAWMNAETYSKPLHLAMIDEKDGYHCIGNAKERGWKCVEVVVKFKDWANESEDQGHPEFGKGFSRPR